jgi:hypothetical protein
MNTPRGVARAERPGRSKPNKMMLPALSRFNWLRVGPRRAKPDFLIIGAARSGTTSLFHYLAGHPQIAVPETKEIHFFDLQYEKGIAWYLDCVGKSAKENRSGASSTVRGEATPSYVFHPHAIPRIKADLPNVKVLALLRNPVDRAYSHYWHMVRLGHETLPFETAIAHEPERLAGELEKVEADASYKSDALVRHSYLLRGIYADQISRVFRYFPRGQVMILKSEDLYTDPQRIFDQVTEFLGIERSAIAGPHNMTAVTEGTLGWRPASMPSDVRRQLAEFFRPHNERLYTVVGRELSWEK